MFKNDSLEKRLNDIRKGKTPQEPKVENITIVKPELKQEEKTPQDNKIKASLKEALVDTISSFLISLLYGYGLNAFFAKEWSFVEVLGVGLLVNRAFETLSIFINSKKH